VAVGTTVGSDSENEHAVRSNDNVNMKKRDFCEEFFIELDYIAFWKFGVYFQKFSPQRSKHAKIALILDRRSSQTFSVAASGSDQPGRKVPPDLLYFWSPIPMNLWKNYHNARSVQDALQALSAAPGDASLIAGGTDLLLDLQQGRHAPVHTLVDITAIPEMTALEIREGELYIGAAVPHAQITQSKIVNQHAAALATASGLVGGPQVRNTATLGGNVAHALPAADGTIALVALDAQAVIASSAGTRRLPLEELFLGPGRSALEPRGELLVGFYLPLKGIQQASAFKRIMRPQGVAIAILNTAVWLHREGDTIADVRIAIGPSGPVPRRLRQAEDALRGQTFGPEAIQAGIDGAQAEANFRTSRHRSTKEYRQKMAGVLLEDTLNMAWRDAGKAGN